jgi:hypothetical protein
VSIHERLLEQRIGGLAKRYPARSLWWFRWRYRVLPMILLVVLAPVGSGWLPTHPPGFFWRPGLVYVVVAMAGGVCPMSGLVTSIAGLLLLVGGYVATPPADPLNHLDWLAYHSGLLVVLSCFYARSWRCDNRGSWRFPR